MEWNLIIHGVTNGQKIWAPEAQDDLEYFKTFYNHKDNDCFEIDLHSTSTALYSVYSLLINNNVIGGDGRTGSYLGVSIRLKNELCVNADLLHKLIVNGVKKHLYGKLVQQSNSGSQYIVTEFNACDADFKLLESYFDKCFTNSFAFSDFIKLEGYPKHSTTEISLSWQDYSDPVVSDYLKQGTKVVLSNFFETKREQKMISDKDSESKRILEELKVDNASKQKVLDNKNNQLQKEIEGLKQTVNNLTKENVNLRDENNKLIQKGNTKALSDAVMKLEKVSESNYSNQKIAESKPFIEKLKYWLLVVLLFLILCVQLFFLIRDIKDASVPLNNQHENPVGIKSASEKNC